VTAASGTEQRRDLLIGHQRVHASLRPGTDPGARPLLLLMGLGGNLGMWEPLRSVLTDQGGMPTIAFDIPGTGGSPVARVPRPLPLLARLVIRVLDELAVDEVDVMGLSWGGLLAQQLALLAPRRVRRVVLANTNFGLGSMPGSAAAIRSLMTLSRYRSADGLAQTTRIFGGSDAPLQGHDPHATARLAMPPSTRGYCYQLISALGWSSLGALPWIRQPTLVLAGDADAAIPVVNARILARGIPHARLHLVPGGGHLVLFQRPLEVAEIVTGFLREQPPLSRGPWRRSRT
jgi:poly(3-hydroxyoctanoate) depolymerase